ncbi:uncharacterized protein LOC106519473 [Austrofundulus limnaeus]|uniref:Uncharacterized protein LOC106519473 n=1 Tax=Austrofundulus limnaeus TaxID=52670 RepID=A0A2I4BFV7_AUSLI|nr:PREDICTED: uncharacterized protein LOC106519473 [Austrofundulus limnaeus]
MQESCRESGDDIDSDYINDSLSDCQSEDIGDSEVYDSGSGPKRGTNETRTTKKKKDKSQNPKMTCRTKKKKILKTVVVSKPNKKEGPSYKKNYCLFCSKPMYKMSRHLSKVHSDKAEVALAFQHPVNSKERKRVWEKLIKEGNFAHNKDVLKTGKGELIAQRRPRKLSKSTDFVPCVHCLGLYRKKSMCVHMKRCFSNGKREDISNGRKRVISQCVLLTKSCGDLSEELKNILGEMVYDEVTETVMEDRLILQFGEHIANEVRSTNKNEYVRQQLRAVGRLVLEAQRSTPMQNLEDFFDPSNFHHVVSAVKVLAGYDSEKKTYTLPSMANKLGYNLKKICGIVQQNAIKSGDTKVQRSCKTFLSLHDKKWRRLISSHALTSMKNSKRKNEKNVPFAEDVKCLYYHMETAYHLAEKNLRENVCPESYAALASVVLAQTIAFNRGKSGEVSSITVKAFMLRKRSEVLDDLDVSVSNLERTLCGFFSRVDIRGSSGRIVPILLKPSFESAMELLIKVRDKCGVHSDNPFVFARTCGPTAYRGSDCIQKYANGCGAKNPKALTLMKLRKHFSTMLQLIHLDENEAQQIFGPNNQIQSMVQNNLCVNTEMQSEGPDSRPKTKHIWNETEVLAVEKHLMQFITNQKIPQKDDCVRCLEAEPLALKKRTWKGVKDYVRNRITTLQRQNGFCKDPSKPSVRRRQKEPQQSSVRPQPTNRQEVITEQPSVVPSLNFGPVHFGGTNFVPNAAPQDRHCSIFLHINNHF